MKLSEYVQHIIATLALIITIIGLFVIARVDFAGFAKDVTEKIEMNTRKIEMNTNATREIIERNSIKIKFTDPPFSKVNSWDEPMISNWFDSPKKNNMDCGSMGKIGRLLGSTFIVSNISEEKAVVEVYLTKKDYTARQDGVYTTPATKDLIKNMIMKSVDMVICDNTPHQVIVVIRERDTNDILKYDTFTIR